MLVRRLLLLAAVLLLLTALAAGLAPRAPVSDVTPLSTGDPEPAAGHTIARTIPAAPGSNTRVSVRRGDVLQLAVAGDTLDTVWLERLDRLDAIEPSTPARFELLIDEAVGDYPIRLVDADRRIGAIEIGPAAR